MIGNNWIALVITFVAALVWLRINDFFAHKGWISSQLSRKIIHIGTGPIFVLCWLLFDSSVYSRYQAALVPLAITVQFFLVGIGVIKDQAAVDGMSRTGDRKEILKGPLFYGIIFVLMTVLYWQDSPIGIVALMLMCGGDGLADIIGKRIQSWPVPWSKNKSIAGSAGMFVGGWIFSVVILWVFVASSIFQGHIVTYLPAITIISLVGMIVESLPINDIDNITVTLAAVLAGIILLPG